MKIQINIDPAIPEDKLVIHCQKMTKEIELLIAALRAADYKLTGTKEGQTYILDITEILYIDTIDRKVFLYTSKGVYETPLKLYALEEQLMAQDFFRASKSSIICLAHVQAIKSDIDGRLIVTMDNEEKLIVSRQYASIIKERLGV